MQLQLGPSFSKLSLPVHTICPTNFQNTAWLARWRRNLAGASCTLMDLRASRSSHLLAPSRMLVSMTASTCARASSSRWFRHLFQAWKAPSLRVCLRSRIATVCSNLAVRYLCHTLSCSSNDWMFASNAISCTLQQPAGWTMLTVVRCLLVKHVSCCIR